MVPLQIAMTGSCDSSLFLLHISPTYDHHSRKIILDPTASAVSLSCPPRFRLARGGSAPARTRRGPRLYPDGTRPPDKFVLLRRRSGSCRSDPFTSTAQSQPFSSSRSYKSSD